MALGDELKVQVGEIFSTQWQTRDGRKVPVAEDLQLGNFAVRFSDAAVLYADLADSTGLVDAQAETFAAEVYKTYLHCCSKIISSEGGDITAFDGDRAMAVFLGDTRCDAAVRCGLKINYAVKNIIQPALKAQYKDTKYLVQQTVGIDLSRHFVTRTGIRNSNDLVWVGPAANRAAKLSGLGADHPTWISEAVFKHLAENSRLADGKQMWEARTWQGRTIYCSTYWWKV